MISTMEKNLLYPTLLMICTYSNNDLRIVAVPTIHTRLSLDWEVETDKNYVTR